MITSSFFNVPSLSNNDFPTTSSSIAEPAVVVPDFLPVITSFRKKTDWIQKGWLHVAIFRKLLFSLAFFLTSVVFIEGIDKNTFWIDLGQCIGVLYTEYALPVNKNPGQFIASFDFDCKDRIPLACRWDPLQESNEYATPDTGEIPKEIKEVSFIGKSWGRPARGKPQLLRGFHRNPGTRWIEYGISSIGQRRIITNIIGNITGIQYKELFLHSPVPVQCVEYYTRFLVTIFVSSLAYKLPKIFSCTPSMSLS